MTKNIIKSFLWISFFGLVLSSWIYIYIISSSMGLDWTGKKIIQLEMTSMQMDSFIVLKMLVSMWSIMMVAMMLPAMVPTLLTYQDLIKSTKGSWSGWIGVLFGYILIWTFFSFGIAFLQFQLTYNKVLNSSGILQSDWGIVIILMIIGLFQFSKMKDFCHGVCIAPFVYFIKKWRNGFLGSIRMGLGLGAFCVGCC